MFDILKLNAISNLIYNNFTVGYNVSDKLENPDAIIVRSASMHEYEVKDKLVAVARAGAGVNNIPIPTYTEKGIAVFNTPGANANAVKELVICALLLASRKITDGIAWAKGLKGTEGVAKQVEAGKKAFAGSEITDKALGIIGYGAIGKKVAEGAVALGMQVYAYDAFLKAEDITDESGRICGVSTLDEIYSKSDYITLHLPLVADTKEMINAKTIAKMVDGVRIINCARGELVSNADIIDALASKKVAAYVTDFPNDEIVKCDAAICIPHLGASTEESEDNCALMASKELCNFLQKGDTINSVNFPNIKKDATKAHRISVLSKGAVKLDGLDALAKDKGEYSYAVIDCDNAKELAEKFAKESNVIKVREIF